MILKSSPESGPFYLKKGLQNFSSTRNRNWIIYSLFVYPVKIESLLGVRATSSYHLFVGVERCSFVLE